MRSTKRKVLRSARQITSLIIVLYLASGIIDSLKQNSAPKVYEIARASNVEIVTEPVAQMSAHKNDEMVYPFKAVFTAYTASTDETDDRPREMASTKEVYVGAIACPDRFIIKDGKRVWGTKIIIEGLGEFTCDDRMNKRYRDQNHFDIYMETKDEAFAFGKQTLNYQVR